MGNRWWLLVVLVIALAGCSHEPPAYESKYTEPSAAPRGVPVAVIGDSYTGGSPVGGKGAQGWPAIVASQLRRQGLDIAPVVGFEGGSGYVNPGNQRGGVFADQIAKVVTPADHLVVVFGSGNDSRVPANELTAAVQRTLAGVKAAAPQAKLLVIGPAFVKTPTPGMLTARDVVKAQAAAVGATFVDPFAEGWFTDRPDLMGSDGAHPNDAGHEYLAGKIAPLIAAQLEPPAS